MMHLRPIAADEFRHFAAIGTLAEHVDDVHEYLQRLLAAGSTRLDWCYLATEGERPSGRCALWTMPGASVPSDFVLLDIEWERPDFDTLATRLLEGVLASMREQGTHEARHVLDSPPQQPQWQGYAERRIAVLEGAGFTLERETRRFEWSARAGEEPPAEMDANSRSRSPHRLVFRSLDEVGPEACVEAIERITVGTLDRRLQREREQLGPVEAARALFTLLQTFTYEPAWWQLAFTPTGDLVGLLMPAVGGSVAVIGYIGVVPEQRGHRYADDLLAQATAILHTSGATRVVADTDTGNAPMANAFRRACYTEFARRREYLAEL